MSTHLGMRRPSSAPIFGFSFMFSRIALTVASPFVLLMYRFQLTFGTLNLLLLLLKIKGITQRTGRCTGCAFRFAARMFVH